MDKITLTGAQKTPLLQALDPQARGRFEVFVDIDEDLTVIATGEVRVDGYEENQFNGGTGAFVETFRSASVTLKGMLYDPETNTENEVEVDDGGAAYRFLNE